MANSKTTLKRSTKKTRIYYHLIIAAIAFVIVYANAHTIIFTFNEYGLGAGSELIGVIGGSVVIGIAIARLKLLSMEK